MLTNSKAFSGFAVDDLSRAQEFYNEKLGLKTSEVTGMRGLLRIHITGGADIMIYEKKNFKPAEFTLLNFPVEDVEGEVDKLSEKGVEFQVYDDENIKTDERGIHTAHGVKIAWFKDPAGNILSLIEDKSQRTA